MTIVRPALLAVFLVLTVLPSARAREQLRVAVFANYPPWTTTTPDGAPDGFEMRLIAELCGRIDADCQSLSWAWEDMIPALMRHDIDAIIAELSITTERERSIAFSDAYIATPAFFAARKGSDLIGMPTLNWISLDRPGRHKDVSLDILRHSLSGRRIGVMTQTVQEAFVRRYLVGPGEIRAIAEQGPLMEALRRGEIDAVLDNASALMAFLSRPEGADFTLFGPALSGGVFGRGVGVGLRKEDTALRGRINAALTALKADGTLPRLAEQWFGYNAAAN